MVTLFGLPCKNRLSTSCKYFNTTRYGRAPKSYLTFAEYLAEQGYDAYLYDHRGHGLDRKFKELGFFASSKGDKVVVADAIDVCAYINKNNRSDKLILFGHSMGSLIARNVIQAYKKFHGVILCGTTHPSRFMTKMAF